MADVNCVLVLVTNERYEPFLSNFPNPKKWGLEYRNYLQEAGVMVHEKVDCCCCAFAEAPRQKRR